MAETDDKIGELQARLENLVKTQISFQQEITQIRRELNLLRGIERRQTAAPPMETKPPVKEYIPPARTNQPPEIPPPNQQKYPPPKVPNFGYTNAGKSFENNVKPFPVSRPEKSEIEKFIGENLISKIGIVVLVIGVAIGAKYAIDKNLISPWMRIVFGYVFGFGLLGFAVRARILAVHVQTIGTTVDL